MKSIDFKLDIEIITEFYKMLRYAIKDMIILPGINLKEAFVFSVGITSVSATSKLLGFTTFIDYRGGILASLILLIVLLTGRRESLNEVLGRDGHADIPTEEIESGTERPVDEELN